MENTFTFMSAAWPWIAMGLLLAIFFARGVKAKKGKEKKEDYGSEGMALGMCFGVALGSALHINIGLAMMAGMVLGLLVGSSMEKEKDQDKEDKAE